MIEEILRNHLSGALSVPVELERPKELPPELVVLERTGGDRRNHIKRASIAAQSYAESLYRAAQLDEEVQEAVLSAAELPEVAGVHLERSYNFTDPAMKRYRYQSIYNITYY